MLIPGQRGSKVEQNLHEVGVLVQFQPLVHLGRLTVRHFPEEELNKVRLLIKIGLAIQVLIWHHKTKY